MPKRVFYKDVFLRIIDLLIMKSSNRIIHSVEYLANICKHYRPRLDGIECDVRSVSILFAVASKGFIMFMGRTM